MGTPCTVLVYVCDAPVHVSYIVVLSLFFSLLCSLFIISKVYENADDDALTLDNILETAKTIPPFISEQELTGDVGKQYDDKIQVHCRLARCMLSTCELFSSCFNCFTVHVIFCCHIYCILSFNFMYVHVHLRHVIVVHFRVVIHKPHVP